MMWFINLLFCLATIKISFRFFKFIQTCFLFKECSDYQAKYGKNSWVIVTGATDGIGWGYCVEFARRGFNIVLQSRTQSKLSARKLELEKLFPAIKVRIIVFDNSEKFTQADYDDMLKTTEDLDICGVVNNVGTMKPFLCRPYVKNDPRCTEEEYKKGDKDA